MKSETMLLIYLFAVAAVSHGVDLGTSHYTNSSGHFSSGDIHFNTTWKVYITPPNATQVFVVMEEVFLGWEDTLTIASDHGTHTSKGPSGPLSLFFEAANLTVTLTTSESDFARWLKGYYTTSGCNYQINDAVGELITPLQFHETKHEALTCNFTFVPQMRMFAKRSVIFHTFQLNDSQSSNLRIVNAEFQSGNYSGNKLLSEIIAFENLVFIFTLNGADTASFSYESVLKESKYVKLNATKLTEKLTYTSLTAEVYSSLEECHWVIESEENTTISFKFINISFGNDNSHLNIYNGTNPQANMLLFSVYDIHDDITNLYISSSSNFLQITLMDPGNTTFVLGEVTMHRYGGYKSGSGEINIPSDATEVTYLLEVPWRHNVVLDKHQGILPANSTVYVYSDFITTSLPVIVYNDVVPYWPIVSSTSQMMVIAKNFTGKANYQASFRGVEKDCYEMSHLESGEYLLSKNCNTTCKWIVPPSKDGDTVISLHLHPIKFEQHDVANLRLLDRSQTFITNITRSTNNLPEFYLPSSSGFLLDVIRGNCSSKKPIVHGTFEKITGCNLVQQLLPGSDASFSSPNFPNSYPLWSHCWINTTTNATNGRFLVTFNRLALAPTHCLKIRDGFGGSKETLYTYEGKSSALPKDLLLNNNASIEFSAQPCNSSKKESLSLKTASGFSLNMSSTDCGDKIIAKTEGNFSTPGFPKVTTVQTCTWIVEVPEYGSAAHSVNIINYTLTRNDSKDYELKIYDGSSIRSELIVNHSASQFLSKTNSLIIIYHRNKSSLSSPGIQVVFHAQECTTKCQNGICIHEDWKCNGINDCGDNTDEIYCGDVPIPSPPSPPEKHSGISPVALGLGLPIAFILGVLAAIFLPPLIRRFRSGQYHQFRDVSADA